jgi:transcriptional regulator with XRE-family HTH domain
MMDAGKFWARVKREVDRQNTSFEWLYGKTGIAKGTFASWKNRGIMPRADEAYRIAEALDVSVEYLLTGRVGGKGASALKEIEEVVAALAVFDKTDRDAVRGLVAALSARYPSR